MQLQPVALRFDKARPEKWRWEFQDSGKRHRGSGRRTRSSFKTQNEKSRRSQSERNNPTGNTLIVYDFAPIGYFTLNAEGSDSLKRTSTGAALLGDYNGGILQRALRRFVKQEDQSKFLKVQEDPGEEPKVHTCEGRQALERKRGEV